MTWTVWDWVICNTLIGVGIILFILIIMVILLRHFDKIFYSIVAKLFNIRRCVIGVHHHIIRENNEIHISNARMKKLANCASKFTNCCGKVVNENPVRSENVTTTPISKVPSKSEEDFEEMAEKGLATNNDEIANDSLQIQSYRNELRQAETFAHNVVQVSEMKQCCWPSKVSVNSSTKSSPTIVESSENQLQASDTGKERVKVSRSHYAHPEHEREVLNVYGKFLTLNRMANKLLILFITVTIISAVVIAGFQGCFLANITVYDNGPCPYYGVMDCYYGFNHTYFQCTPDTSISLPSFASSATCFRWIARDTTISDIMTQIGACAGLLTALGSVVEVFIRFLFFVFRQRLSVATGIRRVMEKTVGINRVTQPCTCCGRRLWFHSCVLNLRLYQQPWLVVIVFIIYILLPMIVLASVILMTYFRISITALTYVVLVTLVMICCLGLLWILYMEDEVGRVTPGAWNDIKDALDSMKKSVPKMASVLESIIPKQDMERFADFTEGVLKDARSHIDTVLEDITSHTEKTFRQLGKHIEKVASKEDAEQFMRESKVILSRARNFQLQGPAQEIRARLAAEKSKDIKNVPQNN